MKQHENIPWELSQEVIKHKSFRFSDFEKEKDLCDYIDANAANFCIDLLEEEYVSHKREWGLNHPIAPQYGTGRRSVDFMFTTDRSECVLVECKNPTHTYSELRDSVSQMMAYRVMCIDRGMSPDRCVIVTSEYHPIVARMIHEYALPFEVFVLGRGQILKMKEVA